MLEGSSFSSDLFVQGVSDEVKWNRQHAQERQIPKRPLLLEELVTSKTPFYRSVLYFANLLLCSAAILPKGERKKDSEKIGRRKAALLQEPEPVTEMQKAKPGLLVTSVKRWFIQSPSHAHQRSPLWNSSFASKCNLVNYHCTSTSEAG